MVSPVDRALSKVNWAVLPVCCIMMAFCYIDRSNVAYAALQLRQAPPAGLLFDAVTYGRGSGFFFISYSLFQIPSNMILTRVGAPVWLTIIVIAWGFFAAVMAAMRSARDFFSLRFLLGMAEAGTFPGLWYHLSLFYPNDRLTMPISITKVATLCAQVASGPLAASLMQLDGAWGMRGWQWMFLVEGACTMTVGATLLFFLPSSPAVIAGLSPADLAFINKGVVRPPKLAQLLQGLQAALVNGRLWWLALAFAVKSCASYSLLFWAPLVIDDLLSPERRGTSAAMLLTSVPYLFSAAFTLAQGWSSQRFNERRLHSAMPFMAGGVLLMVSTWVRGPVASFAVLCGAVCVANGTAPLTAMTSAVLAPESAAAGLALWNSVGNVGGYFGPTAFGVLRARTGSNGVAMTALGGCLFVAGLMILVASDIEVRSSPGRESDSYGSVIQVSPMGDKRDHRGLHLGGPGADSSFAIKRSLSVALPPM